MTNKNPKLKFLVESIFKTFGNSTLKITDHWTDDNNAIGISDISEQNLIYIASYSEDNMFYVVLEYPAKGNDYPYTPGEEFDGIDEHEINSLIKSHILKV